MHLIGNVVTYSNQNRMLPDNNSSDQELLERYSKDGNNEWLGRLLQRYTLLLLGVCMKYLRNEEAARDAVQQIFEKVLQEAGKYPITHFKSWLYMVAKNHCLMQLRQKDRQPASLNGTTNPVTHPEAEWEERLLKETRLDALEAALQHLNEPQRRCVELFYLHKKSYQQIANETGYSLLQVKSYIQNGKRNLRIQLQKQLPDE